MMRDQVQELEDEIELVRDLVAAANEKCDLYHAKFVELKQDFDDKLRIANKVLHDRVTASLEYVKLMEAYIKRYPKIHTQFKTNPQISILEREAGIA